MSFQAITAFIGVIGASRFLQRINYAHYRRKFTIANQPARFARAKAESNRRYLDLEKFYDPSSIKDKVVLVTGCNRGIGLALCKELISCGAKVIGTSRAKFNLEGMKVISGIDVTDDNAGKKLAEALKGQPLDFLVNNAGYFYEPKEHMGDLNFVEEMKMIDICAIGPLRITQGIFNAGLLKSGSSNPRGGDYGHHMSKAAANMCGRLLSQELKHSGICVAILHPGFNTTEMTQKYAHIWEVEGAVDPAVGAKRLVHEFCGMNSDLGAYQGIFINCEDGLEIPW
eukprot:GSChrysophyteH1.ASY1.ANO1.758.1 assembled CDS